MVSEMPIEPEEISPYAEPFHQTILLTTAPLDAVASRIIVDAASMSLEDGEVTPKMVCLAPLEERISLPDWRPTTLEQAIGARTQPAPGMKHPLEEVTGGPDITVPELKAFMDRQIAEGIELLQRSVDLLAEEKSMHNARQAVQRALVAWTQAEMANMRLYSIQFKLDQAQADPEVDRG